MDSKGIRRYIKKYLDGTISKEEENRLEQFENDLIERNIHKAFKHEQYKKILKKDLKSAIDKPYKKEKRRHWIMAASIVLIISISITGYYFTSEPPVEVVKMMASTTEIGQKMNVTLSDGTKVRLNSGSTLRFPEKFGVDIRKVELIGEAFFEVVKDPNKPFIITSGGLETMVLGTSFNIGAYPENNEILVTVATGKVRVASDGQELTLVPNEQAIYDKEQKGISKRKVDIASYVEWKDGTLRMENMTLLEAAKEIEKWYGVKIKFETPRLSDFRFTGTFYNNEKLQVVLESISYVIKGAEYERLGENEILIKEK